MSDKMKVIWIDDNEERKRWATALEGASNIDVNFILVKGINTLDAIKNIREQDPPDLLIIDHILDKSTNSDEIKYGSSVAGILIERWHCCPIMAVTAGDNLSDVIAGTEIYDEFIDIDEIGSYLGLIPSLADGFSKIKDVNEIDSLINLLGSPSSFDIDRLKSCLPHDIKKIDNKNTYAHNFYRWFRNYFYGLPGFLYDKQWVSIVLGIDVDNIDEYIGEFSGALYEGALNNPDSPRWWKSKVYDQVLSASKESTCSSIQGKANELLKVLPKHMSICRNCGNPHPEVMAYEDESETSALWQMHISCTEQHPLYNYHAMFEETRMMLSSDEE